MPEQEVWVVVRETWVEDSENYVSHSGYTVAPEVIGVRLTLSDAKALAYEDQHKLLGVTSWRADWYNGSNYSRREGTPWCPSYEVKRFEVPVPATA